MDSFIIGDKVWDFRYGWGKITNIFEYDKFPIKTDFGGGVMPTYTMDGRMSLNSSRSLFLKK